MKAITSLLVIGAGALVSVQLTINGRLASAAGSSGAAALASLAVGAFALAPLVASGAFGAVSAAGLRAAPAWAWTGGLFGAAYLTALAFSLPRLGAGLSLAGVILGQVAGAALIDGCGLLGMTREPLGPMRVAGLALVAGGAALVAAAPRA